MKTKPRPKPKSTRRVRPKGALRGKLVRIGNSRGVRLPKAVIEQAGLGENVEISVEGNRVVIRAAEAPHPRAGWEEQIKAVLSEHGDDIEEWREWQALPNEFDDKEWTW
jgi:antitoxin MazE